jgi:selT/selW/selH-like putative selenoprotein
LAAEVRQRFPDAEIEMVPSRGGRFEVSYEGQPIFEKSKMKRHASPGEIIRLLEARRGVNA